MAHDTALIVFVIIAGLAFAVQAAFLLGFFLAMREVPRHLAEIRRGMEQRIDPLADSLTQFLAESRDPVQKLLQNLAEISQALHNRADQADAVMAELLDKTRLQIIRVDQLISTLADRVDSATQVVQRSVLAPVREVSALVAGLRTGFEFFFSRRPSSKVSETTQDEELFI